MTKPYTRHKFTRRMRILKILKLNLPYIISLLVVLMSINIITEIKQLENKSVIRNDVVSYYGYLPATFIYHDYTLKFVDNYQGPHQFLIWPKCCLLYTSDAADE